MKIGVCRKTRAGFTLLELVLAIGILGLLMGTIFRLASGTIQATSAVIDRQNEEITLDAFFSLMKRHFEGLPGNCEMKLRSEEVGTGIYTSEMTFQNTPTAFNWGGVAISAEATVIAIERGEGGLFNIVLHYYDEQILDDEEDSAERDVDPVASITLISGLGYVDWQVLDGRTMEWAYEWDLAGRLPMQVELRMAMGLNGEEIRRIFWIPPKQNPVSRMRQLESAARNSVGDEDTGEEPTLPDIPGGLPGTPDGLPQIPGSEKPGGGRPEGGGQGGGRPEGGQGRGRGQGQGGGGRGQGGGRP